MKKYNYTEARREIIDSGIRLGAGDYIDVQALKVAVDALEKLSKVPAMKDHERIFFALCYNLRRTHKPRDVVNLLAETIPHKRCWYYLRKWDNLGFYNYGVTEDLGWFELEKIPQRYLQIVQEENKPAASYLVAGLFSDSIDYAALLAAGKQVLGEIAKQWERIANGGEEGKA